MRLFGATQLLRVVASQSIFTLVNQIISFVVPWIILSRTGSALDAGSAAFALAAAAFIGTLFGGIVVDRLGGRVTSILADIASGVAIIILPIALFFDFIPLWLIIVTQSAGALSNGPGNVAKDALVAPTAKYDKIPLVRAASLQEALQGIAMLIGPLVAGTLVAIISESAALVVVTVLLLVSAVLIAGTARQERRPRQPMTMRQLYADMKEGIIFLRHEPVLWPLTLFSMLLAAIFMPLMTIVFPAWFVFAERGADALGIFLGMQALGTIIGGLIFVLVSTKVSLRLWYAVGTFITALFTFALIFLEPGSMASYIAAFLAGLSWAGLMPISNTAYYARIPEKLFGRVNGVAGAAVLAIIPLTSLFFGWFISATSAAMNLAVIASGMALSAFIFYLIPSMKLLDEAAEH